jgi:sec-independent protein translocase protein TatA
VDFLGIGFGEVLLILVVALIIWGPGRIVEIGLKMGKLARNLRRATFDLTSQVTRELDIEDKKEADSAADSKKPQSHQDSESRDKQIFQNNGDSAKAE